MKSNLKNTASDNVAIRRANHHRALQVLARKCNPGDGLKIWRALRKAEGIAHRAAEQWCNGEIEESDWDRAKNDATSRVFKALGCEPDGFFVNSDPRGYALKIRGREAGYDGGYMPEGLEKDWGGNGLLAPEIN